MRPVWRTASGKRQEYTLRLTLGLEDMTGQSILGVLFGVMSTCKFLTFPLHSTVA